MQIVGISEGYHDAGITILEGRRIVYASHSERYSKTKGDKYLHHKQWNKVSKEDTVAYYEKPFLKNLRRIYAGQTWQKPRCRYDVNFGHHQSHAAAGYYTAPFNDCNILVIDAIGEWDTISIWDNMRKLKSWKYPYSLGLLYSAITHRIGLKPNEEEYITMGMAAFGEPKYDLTFLLDKNNHRGVGDIFPKARSEDLAASIQDLYEREFLKLVDMCPKENLIIMGGCALNCVANSKIQGKNIWIMPSPGDAGSSLGAAALVQKKKLKWVDPYLGHDIQVSVNPKKVVDELLERKICGVAHGKAEFGPRALGNRSLLGDPRYDIKDTVNTIKRRQKFRPFAPSVLEEHAHEIFDMPVRKSQFMQFTAPCKFPKKYPAICHVDNTSRVQTVSKEDNPGYYNLIKRFYEKTGCPMVLNTSLNIKGKPIVNSYHDGIEFEKKYGVKVY